jgi:hypothetical protein
MGSPMRVEDHLIVIPLAGGHWEVRQASAAGISAWNLCVRTWPSTVHDLIPWWVKRVREIRVRSNVRNLKQHKYITVDELSNHQFSRTLYRAKTPSAPEHRRPLTSSRL